MTIWVGTDRVDQLFRLMKQITIHLSMAIAEIEREEMTTKIAWSGDWRWQSKDVFPQRQRWYTTSIWTFEVFKNNLPSSLLTKVRGMVTQHKHMSEIARFPINTFLADRISPDLRTVVITKKFPTHPTIKLKWLKIAEITLKQRAARRDQSASLFR